MGCLTLSPDWWLQFHAHVHCGRKRVWLNIWALTYRWETWIEFLTPDLAWSQVLEASVEWAHRWEFALSTPSPQASWIENVGKPFHWLLYERFLYLNERVTERHVVIDISFSKCPQQARLIPGAWDSIWVSHKSGRDSKTCAIVCCLLGHIIRKWGQNGHTLIRHAGTRQHLQPLHCHVQVQCVLMPLVVWR